MIEANRNHTSWPGMKCDVFEEIDEDEDKEDVEEDVEEVVDIQELEDAN